jgi:8-oxo-dGTP pyrophosphatase MutT (NUDIX family)
MSTAALGAACVIFDDGGRVLLVHHTYGRRNWELPGGGSGPREAPDETARRELLEETGLRAELDRLTGVYFEADHEVGPMVHFVFRCRWDPGLDPVASSPEVGDVGYWPIDDLPTPISDFTERRINDAADDGPVHLRRVTSRQWRE